MKMDVSQVAALAQQLHAQNQVLRSHLRVQNLQNAAMSRGEVWGVPSRNASLPGTPDRSPREANHATGSEAPSRKGSVLGVLSIGAGLSSDSSSGNGGGVTIISPSSLSPGSDAAAAMRSSPVEMVALRPYQSSGTLPPNGSTPVIAEISVSGGTVVQALDSREYTGSASNLTSLTTPSAGGAGESNGSSGSTGSGHHASATTATHVNLESRS